MTRETWRFANCAVPWCRFRLMARVAGVAPPLLVAQRTPERAGDFRVPPFTGVSALAPSPFLAAAARLAPPSGEAVSAPTVAAAPPRSVRRDLLKILSATSTSRAGRWRRARRPPARPPAQRLRTTLACARRGSAPPRAAGLHW